MATWLTEELRKIAEADDLHISPFREDGVTYGTQDLDLVRRGGPRAPRARLQRPEISLVSGRGTAEGGADHCRRDEEGSYVRERRRPDQRPHRRRLPREVPSQSISKLNARRTRSLRNSQGHAARHRCVILPIIER